MISSRQYFNDCKLDVSLYAHQVDSISWMHSMEKQRKGMILSDFMGAGKTRQVAFLMELNLVWKTLIAAPKSVVYSWLRELLLTCPNHYVFLATSSTIQQATNGLNNRIILGPIMSIDILNTINDRASVCVCTFHAITPFPGVMRTDTMLAKDIELGANLLEFIPALTPFVNIAWDRFVLDEAHTLRNGSTCSLERKNSRPKTLKYHRMCRVRMSEYGVRIGLTGTPIQNRLSDIISLLNWIGAPLPLKLDTNAIQSVLCERMFRRTKDNLHPALLSLIHYPEQPYTNHIVKIEYKSSEEKQFYEIVAGAVLGITTRIIDTVYKGIVPEDVIMVRYNMLRYLSTDANMFLRIYNTKHHTNYPAWTGTESKLEAINHQLVEFATENESVIIFVHFYDEAALIVSSLSTYDSLGYGTCLGYKIYYLNGETSIEDREYILYQTKCEMENGERCMILANIQSSGEGLNLQHFSKAIISSPDWNPACEDQACGRLQRIGQRKHVHVYRFIHSPIMELFELARGHIDNYMVDTQEAKKDIFHTYITEGKNAAYFWPRIDMPGYPFEKACFFPEDEGVVGSFSRLNLNAVENMIHITGKKTSKAPQKRGIEKSNGKVGSLFTCSNLSNISNVSDLSNIHTIFDESTLVVNQPQSSISISPIEKISTVSTPIVVNIKKVSTIEELREARLKKLGG